MNIWAITGDAGERHADDLLAESDEAGNAAAVVKALQDAGKTLKATCSYTYAAIQA